MASKNNDFKIGDLVFAKVKGYPAWPARIDDPEENEDMKSNIPKTRPFLVFFFGTHEVSFCAAKDLTPLEQGIRKFGAPKKSRSFNEGLWELENSPDVGRFDPVGGVERVSVLNEEGALDVVEEEEEPELEQSQVNRSALEDEDDEDDSESSDDDPLILQTAHSSQRQTAPRSLQNLREVAKSAKPVYAGNQFASEDDSDSDEAPLAKFDALRKPAPEPIIVEVDYEDGARAEDSTRLRGGVEDSTRLRGCPKSASISPASAGESRSALQSPEEPPKQREEATEETGASIGKGHEKSSRKRKHSRRRYVAEEEEEEEEQEEKQEESDYEMETRRKRTRDESGHKSRHRHRQSASHKNERERDHSDRHHRSRHREEEKDHSSSRERSYNDAPRKSARQQLRNASPEFEPDVIYVTTPNVSKHRAVSPIPDDPRNFESKAALEAKAIHRYECEIKKALQVGNYDIASATRCLNELKQKIDCGDLNAEVLLRLPTILETVKKCRKFSASTEIRNAAAECVEKIKRLFAFNLHTSHGYPGGFVGGHDKSDEEWFKNFKSESERFWRENKEWANHIRNYISAFTKTNVLRKQSVSKEPISHPTSSATTASVQQDSAVPNNAATTTGSADCSPTSPVVVASNGTELTTPPNQFSNSDAQQTPTSPDATNTSQPVTPKDVTEDAAFDEAAQRIKAAAINSDALGSQRQSGSEEAPSTSTAEPEKPKLTILDRIKSKPQQIQPPKASPKSIQTNVKPVLVGVRKDIVHIDDVE